MTTTGADVKPQIDRAIQQLEALRRRSGGSLRYESFRVKDTMDEIIAIVDKEHD